jgi:hypothetical protein
VGQDIEVMLRNAETGQIIPCVDLVEGTKAKPQPVEGYPNGFAIQEDNVMLEYNAPPASSSNEFYEYCRTARSMVTKVAAALGCVPEWIPEHTFTEKQLASPQAQTFGCEPDQDAWNGGATRTVNEVDFGNTRSCGGHIHLGGDFQCPDFVAALFMEYRMASLGREFISKKSERQRWYGRPGIFRSKPYGIEYRTPDNSWAGDNNNCHYVGYIGIDLAKFLTESSALEIQTKFQTLPWTKLRKYMTGNHDDLHGDLLAAWPLNI